MQVFQVLLFRKWIGASGPRLSPSQGDQVNVIERELPHGWHGQNDQPPARDARFVDPLVSFVESGGKSEIILVPCASLLPLFVRDSECVTSNCQMLSQNKPMKIKVDSRAADTTGDNQQLTLYRIALAIVIECF